MPVRKKVTKKVIESSVPVRKLSFPSRKRLYMIGGVAILLVLGFWAYKFLVIAWVDGKPINRIALYQQLEKRYGADMKNQLVAESLINSEAKKRAVSVSPAEVETEYQKFVEQYGGVDNINSALSAQGIKPEDFKDQIRVQTLIKKMFTATEISDDEVNKYIASNADQYKDATDTAKLMSDVRQQLQQQKVTQDFRTWLQEAMKSSRVIQL